MAVNRDKAPFKVRSGKKEGVDLVAEWKIVDAKWYELFAKAGIKRVFKVLMKFDERKGEVRSVDQEWEVEWRAGEPILSLKGSAFRGRKWEKSFETVYAFREDGSPVGDGAPVESAYLDCTAQFERLSGVPALQNFVLRRWSTREFFCRVLEVDVVSKLAAYENSPGIGFFYKGRGEGAPRVTPPVDGRRSGRCRHESVPPRLRQSRQRSVTELSREGPKG
jgi:hypothetical protein